jgi:hypothetical protein
MIFLFRKFFVQLFFSAIERQYIMDVLLAESKSSVNLAIQPGLEKSLMRFYMRSSGRAQSLAELFE